MEAIIAALLFGASLLSSGPSGNINFVANSSITANAVGATLNIEPALPQAMLNYVDNTYLVNNPAEKIKEYIIKYKESATQGLSMAEATSQAKSLQLLHKNNRVARERKLFNDHALATGIRSSQAKVFQKEDIKNKFSERALRAPKSSNINNLSNYYVIEVQSTKEASEIISEYKKNGLVESIEENKTVSINRLPNDTYLDPSQTGSWSKGFFSSTIEDLWGLKAMKMSEAWNLSSVSYGLGIVVAVVDTGVDYNHEDLQSNMWVNTGEIPGNGIDDDGNGYVDDYMGYNFVGKNSNPMDDHYHGTHVAGTIAAVGNNKTGIIGVASKAKIMPVKGLDSTGSGSIANLAMAIEYAADNGADVINNSWGGEGSSTLIADAIQYALAMGCVVVNAAGNSAMNADNFFPANVAGAIAVAALYKKTDGSYGAASFTNYGSKITVTAPGVSILSLQASCVNPYVKYRILNGTSMAAPNVAGTVALMLANKPYMTGTEVISKLKESATFISTIPADYQGAGLVNVYGALSNGEAPPPWSKGSLPLITTIDNMLINENLPLSFWAEAYSEEGLALTYSMTGLPRGASFSNQTFSWTPDYLQAGVYKVTLIVMDSNRNGVQTEISITVNNVYQSPKLATIGNKIISENNTLSFTLSSSETEPAGTGSTLSYTATALPLGATFTNKTFSWTPSYTDSGKYALTFLVADGLGGQAQETVIITVNNVNRLPMLNTLPLNLNGLENKTLTFAVSAVDPDGEGISYSLSGLPIGATFVNQLFSWLPSFTQAGIYPLVITATDPSNGMAKANMNLIITDVNREPVLIPINNKLTNENQLLGFTVNASDPDGDNLIYGASGLPNGATYTNRVFSWKPDYTMAGRYPVVFTVADGKGAITQESIIISVNNVYQAPVLSAIGNKRVSENDALIFAVQGSETEPVGTGSTLSYTATALPQGATFTNKTFTWTPSYTDAGKYTLTFMVADGLGGQAQETVVITVNNINRLPVINTLPLNLNGLENKTLTFAVSAVDPDGEGINYSLSGLPIGATFVNQQFSWLPSFTQAGTYPLVITATDPSNGIAKANMNLIITDVNREPVLISINNKLINENQLLGFTVNASDPDGDSLIYGASGLPKGATYTNRVFSWKPDYTMAGRYPVVFTVADGKGALTQENIIITVNNIYQAPVLTAIGNKRVNEAETLSFTLSGSETEPVGTGAALSYTVTALPQGATFTNKTFTWTPSYTDAGKYNLTFMVADGLGGQAQETVIITVNNVNRLPVFNTLPSNLNGRENQTLTFAVSAVDPDGEGISYSMSDIPLGASFSNQCFNWTPNYFQSGYYWVTILATDTAGGVAKIVVNITVNDVNRVPIMAPIPNQVISENQALSFKVSASDADGDPLSYSLTDIPGGASFANQTFSWTPSYTQAGVYKFNFIVGDSHGGEQQSLVTLTVNNVNRPPQIIPVVDQFISENKTLNFTIIPTDPDGDKLTTTITGLPSGAVFDGQMVSWIPSYNQSGVYPLIIKVIDEYGAQAQQAMSITVYNANRLPLIEPLSAKIVSESQVLSFKIVASDPDGDNLVYTVAGLPSGAIFSNQIFSWTPSYSQAGSYTLTFKVTDSKGDSAQTNTTIMVNDVNRVQFTSPLTDKNLNENEILTFTVNASDPDGSALSYSITSLPTGATFINRVFSWKPDFTQAGVYPMVILAQTSIGTQVQASMKITVNNVYRAPVLTAIGNKIINENDALSFTIQASETEGVNLNYSVAGLPVGAVFSNKTFSWNPSYTSAGTYSLTFKVTDGLGGQAQETIIITLNNVNRLPVITAIKAPVVNENQMVSFDVSASDPDGETITYSISGLPSGATFNNQQFSWLPNFSQAGYYPVTITVRDSSGGVANAYVVITVMNVNREPLLTNVGNQVINENQSLSFTINASDPDGDNVSWVISGLPSGATFINKVFSWKPDYKMAGIYPITFTATDTYGLATQNSIIITVQNVYQPPVLTKIGSKICSENLPLSFKVQATETEGVSLSYTVTGLPLGATFNNQTLVWVPDYTQAGVYPLTIVVSDLQGGKAQESLVITVNNVNRLPIFTPLNTQSVIEGQPLSFQIRATDLDGEALSYGATGLPTSSIFSAPTFNWTPSYNQAGAYTITFIATDTQGGAVNLKVSIVVSDNNRPPVLQPIANQVISENQTTTFQVKAIDPDGDYLTYNLSSMPAGAVFASQLFSWTPNYFQAGVYKMNLNVSDMKGGEQQSIIIITVNNINRPPAITALSNWSVNENQLVSFYVNATDPDGDSLTYTVTGIPEGAVFSNRTFTWIPTSKQSGVYNLSFQVNDNNGGTAQTQMTIVVNNVNQAPWFDPLRFRMIKATQPDSFIVNATDPDGDNLTYSVLGAPSNAMLNNQQFSWTPSAEQVGLYRVKFTANDGYGGVAQRFMYFIVYDNVSSLNAYVKVLNDLPSDKDTPGGELFTQIIKKNLTNTALMGMPTSYLPEAMEFYGINQEAKGEATYMKLVTNSIDSGKGLWLKTSEDMVIFYDKEDEATSDSIIQIHEGWNIICNPFLEPLNWKSLLVRKNGKQFSIEEAICQGLIGNGIHSFENNNYISQTDMILEPWKGYYVLAKEELEIVYPRNTLQAKAKTMSESDSNMVSLKVYLSSQLLTQSITLKAGKGNALYEDIEAPPMVPGQGIEIVAVKNGVLLGSSMQEYNEQNLQWDIRLNASIAENVSLKLAEENNVSGHKYQYYLLDANNKKSELGKQEVVLPLAKGIQSYKIQAIAASSVAEKITAIVNYPNPFNPASREQVKLNYTLSEAMSGKVQIYTLSGKLLRTSQVSDFTEGSSGVHSGVVIWDGRDEAGNMLTSGLYLYVMNLVSADGKSNIKQGKILLWK